MITELNVGISAIGMLLLTGIFQLLFAWTSMRKFRKNKDLLGYEFISGMSITNVAMSMTWVRFMDWVHAKGEANAAARGKPDWAAGMLPDHHKLLAISSRYDRVLARLVAWTLVLSVTLLGLAMLIGAFS